MKVTARDVAARAGTSVSAVSRAFQPASALSDDKRRRVLEAARELGYRTPSAQAVEDAAARLADRAVGVIVGDLSNPFYPTVLETLAQELFRRDRRLVLHVAPQGFDADAVLDQLIESRAAGAIATSASLSSRVAEKARARGLPLVLFNRASHDGSAASVLCDNAAGGRAIGARLARLGAQRIGLIGGRPDTSTHRERAQGFREALAEAGAVLSAEALGGFVYDQAYEAAAELLAGAAPPDALFCANDVMALAAIDAARETGRRVPGDLAVIGFDDIPMAAWRPYRLTTMRQPIRRMIVEAIDLIEAMIADPSLIGASRVTPPRWVVRDSDGGGPEPSADRGA